MKSINILAVDDDAINLKLVEVMLKKYPYLGSFIKASNGLEALNIIDSGEKIDLILLDIVMPVMNGLEFLNNLQSRADKSSIPVIVLTTDETIKREAFNKGAYDFLTKPILKESLLAKIDEIMPVIGSES